MPEVGYAKGVMMMMVMVVMVTVVVVAVRVVTNEGNGVSLCYP